MRLYKKLLYLFAASAMLASCSSDDTDSGNGGPANVQKLETPKNGLSVSMLLLDPDEFEGLRFEWQPATGDVTYELAFDKNGGSFSAPVASFETTENNYTLQLEEIQALFDENVDEAGETAVLDWRVYTLTDTGRTPSNETRTLTLTTRAEVVVETLIAPENDAVLNLKELTEDVDFSWSEPVWLGDEKQISYTLVIDQADADFSEPLLSIDVNPTAEAAAATQTTVTQAQLAELYNASEAAATEDPYYLQWAVYAKIDQNVKISEEIRTFSIIPQRKIGAFAEGDTLYIGIPESSEDGQKATFINDGYYRTDNDSWHDRLEKVGQDWNDFPYYEIFTRLEAGEQYGFYTLSDDEKIHFFKATSADGFVETESEEESYTTVEDTGIYRIRFKADGTNKIDIRKVEYINLRFAWGGYDANSYTDAEMNYAGKGLWTLSSYHIVLRDMGSYKEDRYRFVMKLDGIDQVQGLSKNNQDLVTDDRPGQSEDSSYWHLQLSYTGWDHWVFKYPAWLCDETNLGKWAADVNLYMNADKGHYTHEFVNPVEVKSFADGDALYIDGTGTEAGQQMAYISGSYYNPGIDNAGGEADAFKDEDYKYEIFTKIEGNSKFYFRSQFSDALYTLSAEGTQVKQIESTDEAEAPIAETGIYRIRFNIATGNAYIASIDKVSHFFCWTSEETEMTYEGKGVWVIDDLNIKLQKTDWGFDERYKFKFIIDGEQQYYGRMDSNGERPNASTAASYRYVQPGVGDQWATAFKYSNELCDGNDLDRWYADLRLYMNVEMDHYTHEFTNAHE